MIAPGLGIFILIPLIIVVLIFTFLSSNLYARYRISSLSNVGVIDRDKFNCLPGQVAWASLFVLVIFTVIPQYYLVGIGAVVIFNVLFFYNVIEQKLINRQLVIKYLGPQYIFVVGIIAAIIIPIFIGN
jgi:hypothetical protein